MKNKEVTRVGAQNGAIILTLSTLIVKLLGVIYKIPLIQLIGEEGMGYFNSAYTVYTFFYLLCTAGVPKAVMIVTSEARGKGQYDLERKILKTTSLAFLLLGGVLSAVFAIFSAPLANAIGNSKSAFSMLAVAPSIVFIALAGVIRGGLSARMKFGVIAVSQVVEASARLAFGLAFAILALRWNMPLFAASAFTILGATLGAFFGLICLVIGDKNEKICNNSKQNDVLPEPRSVLKRVFSISLPITLGAAVMSVTGIIDLGQIMRALASIGYSEESASALYGNYTTLAVPMFNLAVSVITPISIAYLPVFTRARSTKDEVLLKNSVEESLSLSAFLCAPITVGVCCYSKEILYLLFGNKGLDVGAPLLVMLIPAVCFASVLLVVNTLLESLGYVRIPVVGMLLGGCAKLILGGLLLKNPNLGISGAPLGTVISYAVSLMVSLYYAERKCGISIPFIKTAIPYYCLAVASILPTIWINGRLLALCGARVAFIFVCLLSAAVYLSCTHFLCSPIVRRNENRSKCTKYREAI